MQENKVPLFAPCSTFFIAGRASCEVRRVSLARRLQTIADIPSGDAWRGG